MSKVQWVHYFDVWGNTEDGFQVNDLSREWTANINSLDNEALFQLLKNRGFFKEWVELSDVEFEDLYPFVELSDAETGEPLGRFEILED